MFRNIAVKEEDYKRVASHKAATGTPIWKTIKDALVKQLGVSPFEPQPKQKARKP